MRSPGYGRLAERPDPARRFADAARRAAVPLMAVAACLLVLALARQLSLHLDYYAVLHAVRGTPIDRVGYAIAATAVSFAALIARDVCALRYVGARPPAPAVLLGAFCGTALGNAVGFGTFTGGAVRYRVYGAVGVAPDAVGRIMLFLAVGFALGLAAFAGGSALMASRAIGRLLDIAPSALQAGGLAALATAILAVALCARWRSPFRVGAFELQPPSPHLAAAQMALTAVDVAAAAAALWFLLPDGRIDFGTFAAIFSAAIALGVISHVPGGIGVFEAVVVFALGGRVPPSLAAAALLAYRGIYFLLPLLLGAALLAAFELQRLADRRLSALGERVARAAGRLAPSFLGVITFAAGVMLLASGATPAFEHRLALLQLTLPLWVVEASHFLGSLAGVVLLFVARGLFHRLDAAWWLAIGLAVANLALSLAKGLAFVEVGVLLVVIVLLLATRREFDRRASMFGQAFSRGWLMAVTIIIAMSAGLLVFAFQDVAYTHRLWWEFEFDAQAPRAFRAVVGAAVLAAALSLWQLLRPAAGRVAPPSAGELARAAAIIRRQERSDAMLAMMGDKSFLFSASGRSLLMYSKRGRSWVALFDPVGPREEWAELIWRLVELADSHGGRAAFYQVRPDSLPLYLDAGLKVMKLGEEATVDLGKFNLDGSRRAGLRYALKRGERDGLSLEVLDDPRTAANELRAISEKWLTMRRAHEKRFSVAAFTEDYVAAQAVALLRQNGVPVAFVTFMTTEKRSEATIGLMRHIPEASPYAMEFLLTRLMLHLREAGFRCFSLGMAPLSGLSRTPLSSRWHRMAGLVWERGGRFYNFQGLRAFKGKFHPAWEPRYLAASGTVGPFLTLAHIAALANAKR